MINCCIARKKAREEVERRVQGMDINDASSGEYCFFLPNSFFLSQLLIAQYTPFG